MNLEALVATKQGRSFMQSENDERLNQVNLAAYTGNKVKLADKQKKAFHSPCVRYKAFQKAASKQGLNLSPSEIAKRVAGMDWKSPLQPRRVYALPSKNGTTREVSAAASVEDSAKAYLLKAILDAEWQGQLDDDSYAVEGKGVAEAMGAISTYTYGHPMWYLKTDIKACFSTINREVLIKDLQTKLSRYMWIKLQPHLGVILDDGQTLWFPETGIPTGNPLSALILDIYFKDLSHDVTAGFSKEQVRMFRYVDDLLILSPDLEVVAECGDMLQDYVEEAGLKLNSDKTIAGTTAAIIDRGIPPELISAYPDRNIPIGKAGVVFLGVRLSHYLDPEGTNFDTWLELEIPKDRLKGMRSEERSAYHESIWKHVKNIRGKVGDKAFVGSWLNYEMNLPMTGVEEFGGVGYGYEVAVVSKYV